MIVDMDTHILPRDMYDYIEGPAADRRPVYHFDENGVLTSWKFPGWHHVEGTSPIYPPGSGARYTGLSEMDARVKDYEKLGIARQLLLPQYSAAMFNYALDVDLAVAMAHSYNLSILNIRKQYPEKIIAAALVALQDVPSAIAEMEWARKNGFQALALDKVFPVRAHPYSDTLGSHRELWPFFRRADELGMPIVLHAIQHGHRVSNMKVFQRDGLEITCPPDGHLSLMSLCTSGLFDDLPNLRFVFTEAGSAFIRPLVDQFDRAFAKRPISYDDEDAAVQFHRRVPMPGEGVSAGKRLTGIEEFASRNKHPPSYYFRKNLFFTVETEEPELPDSIEYLGGSQFLFATDYPHDDPGGAMKWKDVALLRGNPRIQDDDKSRIASGNALRILPEQAWTSANE